MSRASQNGKEIGSLGALPKFRSHGSKGYAVKNWPASKEYRPAESPPGSTLAERSEVTRAEKAREPSLQGHGPCGAVGDELSGTCSSSEMGTPEGVAPCPQQD